MGLLGPFSYPKRTGATHGTVLESIWRDLVANMGSVYANSPFVQAELLAQAKAIFRLKLALQEDHNNRFIPARATYNLPNEVNKFNLGFLKNPSEQRAFLGYLYASGAHPQNLQTIDAVLRIIAPTIYGQQPNPSIFIDSVHDSTCGTNLVNASGATVLPLMSPAAITPPYGGSNGQLNIAPGQGLFLISSSITSSSIAAMGLQQGDMVQILSSATASNQGNYAIMSIGIGVVQLDAVSGTNDSSGTVQFTFVQKFAPWSSSIDKLRIYLNPAADTTSQQFQREIAKIDVYLQQTLPAWTAWEYSQTSPFYLGPDDGMSPIASYLDGYTRFGG